MPRRGNREPRTKREFIDKLMSHDFTGDIKDLATDRKVSLHRVKDNAVEVEFATSGVRFVLSAHRPRTDEMLAAARAKREAKTARRNKRAAKKGDGAAQAPAPSQQEQQPQAA